MSKTCHAQTSIPKVKALKLSYHGITHVTFHPRIDAGCSGKVDMCKSQFQKQSTALKTC